MKAFSLASPALKLLLAVIPVFAGVLLFNARPAEAAVITWDGGGTDGTCGGAAGDGNKWACGANWVGDVAPGASDIATFDGTSTKDATIAATISVAGIDVNTGYTGTITQGSGAAMTIGTSDWDMSAGFFVGGNSSITCGANCFITISGGSFTSTTGNLSISGAFTLTSGSFEPSTGTVTATGTAGATWDFLTTETFYNVTVQKSSGISMTMATGDTFIVTNTLTLTDGFLSGSGVMDARGNITQASTFDGGSGTIDFGADGVAQTYTISGGTAPTIEFDAAADANDAVNVNAAASFDMINITSGFSGNVPLNNASNFVLTVTDWTQAAGTYDASAQSSWNLFDFNITGGTFIAPTLITTTGSSVAWDLNVTQTFNQFTINKSNTITVTIPSGDTLIVTGLLTLSSGGFSTGTINAQGNITQTSGYDGGSGTLNFANDGVAQTYTLNGGETPFITFDDPDDANDDIDVVAASSFQGFVVTSGFSGAVPVNNPSDFTLTFAYLEMAAGTWDASAQSAWTVTDFEITGGTLSPAATVTTTGSAVTWNFNTSQTFNNLNINRSNGANLTITSGDTALTTGTLTLTNGNVNTGTLEARGDVSVVLGFDGGTATLKFSGSATQSFTLTSAAASFDGDIQVNKSGGQVNLTTALTLDASSQDLVIQEGKFNLNGQTLIINGTSGVFTVEDGGNFQLQGAETITLNASQPTLSTGSTVTYVGNGTGTATTYTITTLKSTYHHLVINSTDGTTDTYQLGSAIDINGDFTLTIGTFDTVSGQNYAMNVAGNWTNTGAFTARNGTVTLDGASQTLAGATTFYNLTKTVATAATLTLPAATTQTISNTLTLQGASGQLLSLRSSITDTQARIDPQGSRSIQYLDVKDSNNLNATAVQCTNGCTNSLNNTNWTFPGVTLSAISGNTTEAGGTATFTAVLNSQPSVNVSFNLATGDATEGTALPATLTFTNGNWDQPQTVTVTGVNDDLDDGDVVYSIVTEAISSGDANYNGVNPGDVSVTNTDNDTSGFTVSAISGNTTEAGVTATYTIVLTAQPTATVNVGVTSNDTGEGTVSPSSLAFTTADWASAHIVTVTGVADDLDDGDIAYTLINAAATSADLNYNGLNPNDVAATNVDTDVSAVTVSAPSGNTTEAGTTATFTIVLDTQPSASVSIGISAEDVSELSVSPSSVTFTTVNWATPQEVTVTGVDDARADGDIASNILLAAATSADGLYNGVDPEDVVIVNIDNDEQGSAGYSGSGYVPSIRYTGPEDGVVLGANTETEITWDTGGFSSSYVNIYVSYDGGDTYEPLFMNAINDGSLVWEVPNIDSPETVIKVALTDLVLESAIDVSTPFVIAGGEEDGVIDDDGATDEGSGSPGNDGVIDTVLPNSYIRGYSFPDVYYVDGDFIRHPIINEQVYFTYEDSWDAVTMVSDVTLPTLTVGSVVLPKPGVVLVKIESVPNVYAAFEAEDGSTELRWIVSEQVATDTYGSSWADYVVDIPPTFWTKFTFGEDILTPIDIDLVIMKKRVDLHE